MTDPSCACTCTFAGATPAAGVCLPLLSTIVIVDEGCGGEENIDLLLNTGRWLHAESKTRYASKAPCNSDVEEVDDEVVVIAEAILLAISADGHPVVMVVAVKKLKWG